MELQRATLTLRNGRTVEVTDEHQLSAQLASLDTLQDGQIAALERGQSDFIKATRCGVHWSVTAKRGRMWTAQSFTAEKTSDYSARRAREGDNDELLRQRLMWWLRSPLPERALSTKQVKTLFAEYLSGRKFTLSMSGAIT